MHDYMAEALRLAKLALGRTSPNPLVGAVIVKNGKIVGRGYHHQAGTPHAEIHALAEAGEQANGATIYVTLEPCSHFGRTPPCSQALIKAGIKKVVVAMEDPNPKVAGNGIRNLRNAGIAVEVGDHADEARRLNEAFVKYITTKLPFTVFKTALSLDGKIATATGDSRWITAAETRAWTHSLRNQYDAIMVGINTVLLDDPELTCRIPGGRNPIRLVADSKLQIPLTAKVIAATSAPLFIATTTQAPQAKIAELERRGVKLFVYDSTQVPLKAFLTDLGQAEISSILLEGGATLAWGMFAANLVDKVHFCFAPKLIGGHNAPTSIGGPGVRNLAESWAIQDLQVKQIGPDFVFTGYPQYSPQRR